MKTLLIMAAGNGSRYGALKQFDPLGPEKEYLFEFSIFDGIKNGFEHIVIITKEAFVNDIRAYLKLRLPEKIKIDVLAQEIDDVPAELTINFERTKPWGTAHAVWTARNCIENSFIVINADDYYGSDAFHKANDFLINTKMDEPFGLVPYTLKDTLSKHGTVSRGICNSKDSKLLNVTEMMKIEQQGAVVFDLDSQTTLTGEEPASMNFWICHPSIFEEIEVQFKEFLSIESEVKKGELYIPLIIQRMIDSEKATIFLTDSSTSWFGVTYAEDKMNAVNVLKTLTEQKKYPSPLWKS